MYLALNRVTPGARRAQPRLNALDGATAIDQLFDGFFHSSSRAEQAGASLAARFDVVERPDRYEAHIEIPGVAKDDIDVQIDGATVRVKAEPRVEVKPEADLEAKSSAADGVVAADAGTVLHTTRATRSWFRNFTLPAEVDEARAEAAYQDGILTLTLPKKDVAQPKRLAIR